LRGVAGALFQRAARRLGVRGAAPGCRRRSSAHRAREMMQAGEIESALDDLVIANRILANENVVDAYGHVSLRHPRDPRRFFLARSLSPDRVERGDLMEFDLEGKIGRASCRERV